VSGRAVRPGDVDRSALFLIERMQREGRSERAIVAAMLSRQAAPKVPGRDAGPRVRRLWYR